MKALFTSKNRLFFVPSILLVIFFVSSIRSEEISTGFQMVRTAPGLSLHKEMFMLPVTFSDEYDGAKTEAVFQISAKHRIFNTPVYFAYTQISFWQAYDHKNSAPFRETNYNPEIFYRTKSFNFHGGMVGADLGFEHESNGQKPPVSRSWNLLYACPYYSRSNLLFYLKFRYRIPEDEKEYPDAAIGDDNPDITDYLGYNDVNVFYRFYRRHVLHLMLRGNINTGKGGIILNYSVPLPRTDMSYINIRISHGYGESLVDYNRSLTRVGLGIMFSR